MSSSSSSLMEGWMRKQQKNTRLWHDRYFTLYEDRLVHSHKPDSSDFKKTFMVAQIECVRLSEKYSNAFEVQVDDNGKESSIIFRLESSNELDAWIEEVKKSSRNYQEKYPNAKESPTVPVKSQPLDKKGLLLKKSGNKYTLLLQERYVCIEGALMKYYKKKGDRLAQGSINLQQADVARMYDSNVTCKTFEINEEDRTFEFSAKDNLEAREWVAAVNQARILAIEEGEKCRRDKKLAGTSERVRFYDENGIDEFHDFISADLDSLYPLPVQEKGQPKPASLKKQKSKKNHDSDDDDIDNYSKSMTIEEHIECAEAIAEYLIDFVPETAKLGTSMPARYDILLATLTIVNELLNMRLGEVVREGSALLHGAVTGDIHALIAWISNYHKTLIHIYCPLSTSPTHGFVLNDCVPSLCDRYINGANGNDGAAAHLIDHCARVWANVSSKPSEMLQRHRDGSFFTYAPTDMWEALNQHLILAKVSESQILYALIIEIISTALKNVVEDIVKFVKTEQLDESEELEFLSALANDNAKHIEEVIEVVKSFEDVDLRSNVSKIFDEVTKQLVSCGEACIKRLSFYVIIDLKGVLDNTFTSSWMENSNIEVILATVDDYLKDFLEFLMPYWGEKIICTMMDELLITYFRSIVFPGDAVSSLSKNLVAKAFADNTSEKVMATLMAPIKTTNVHKYFRRGSKSRHNSANSSLPSQSSSLSTKLSSSPSSKMPKSARCVFDEDTVQQVSNDIIAIRSFFVEKCGGDEETVERSLALAAEILSFLTSAVPSLKDLISELLIRYPFNAHAIILCATSCMILRELSNDSIVATLAEVKEFYTQAKEMTSFDELREGRDNSLGSQFSELAMMEEESSRKSTKNIKSTISGHITNILTFSSSQLLQGSKAKERANGDIDISVKAKSSKLAGDVQRLIDNKTEKLVMSTTEAELQREREDELLRTRVFKQDGFLEKKSESKGMWQNRWFKLLTKQNYVKDVNTDADVLSSLSYSLLWSKNKGGAAVNSVELQNLRAIKLISSPRKLCVSTQDSSIVLESTVEDFTEFIKVKCKNESQSYYVFSISLSNSKEYVLRTDEVDAAIKWITALSKTASLNFKGSVCEWNSDLPEVSIEIALKSVDLSDYNIEPSSPPPPIPSVPPFDDETSESPSPSSKAPPRPRKSTKRVPSARNDELLKMVMEIKDVAPPSSLLGAVGSMPPPPPPPPPSRRKTKRNSEE